MALLGGLILNKFRKSANPRSNGLDLKAMAKPLALRAFRAWATPSLRRRLGPIALRAIGLYSQARPFGPRAFRPQGLLVALGLLCH